jgi:hypothetical protein
MASMEWLWTWGGSSFGYREAGELWTYDGRHVGRFHGHEVYGADGLYLGEVMNGDRLIVNSTKKTRRTGRFDLLPERPKHPSGIGFDRVALPNGFGDFPRPDRLR